MPSSALTGWECRAHKLVSPTRTRGPIPPPPPCSRSSGPPSSPHSTCSGPLCSASAAPAPPGHQLSVLPSPPVPLTVLLGAVCDCQSCLGRCRPLRFVLPSCALAPETSVQGAGDRRARVLESSVSSFIEHAPGELPNLFSSPRPAPSHRLLGSSRPFRGRGARLIVTFRLRSEEWRGEG